MMNKNMIINSRLWPYVGKLLATALGTALSAATPLQAAEPATTETAKTEPAKTAPAKKAAKKKPAAVPSVTAEPSLVPSSSTIEFAPQVGVTVGKSTLLKLPTSAVRISVGNPAVADVILLNPNEVYLLGKTVGSTNIILWSKSGHSTLVDVIVGMDTAALQGRLQHLLPGEKNIRVTSAADSVVLSGVVTDSVKVDRAVALAEAYSGKKVVNLLSVGSVQQVMLEVKIAEINRTMAEKLGFDFARQFTGGGGTWTKTIGGFIGGGPGTVGKTNNVLLSGSTGSASSNLVGTTSSVLNGTTSATSSGFDPSPVSAVLGLSGFSPSGGGVTTVPATFLDNGILSATVPAGTLIPTNVLVNTASSSLGATGSTTAGTTSALSNSLSSSSLASMVPGAKDFWSFMIDAEKKDGLVKILAEPNIVALSGQEGSFLAGGEIMIPVQQSAGVTTLESKQFGVGLKFTPTVLEDGRIHIRVLPEVTDLVGFTSVASNSLGGSVLVPTLTTRRVSTAVELREGQSLAIGGLLSDNFRENVNRFPLLGEIPILGTLFRSSEFQKNKTELLIVVTPRLVKPLAPNYALPTDNFKEPTRSELFFEGKMEGTTKDESQPEAAPAESKSQAPATGGFQMK